VRGGDILERGATRVVVRKVRRHQVQEAQITQESSVAASPSAQPTGRPSHHPSDGG
jgi:hypothetical protein